MKVFSRYKRWLNLKRIAFDTSFLIALLEDDSRQIPRLFELAEKRSLTLMTSTVTLLEVLVRPYRNQALDVVNLYYGYLVRAPFVRLFDLSPEIADRAAELRARYNFKTPDAIQLATALAAEAKLFLTQDREFRKQKEIEVGIL